MIMEYKRKTAAILWRSLPDTYRDRLLDNSIASTFDLLDIDHTSVDTQSVSVIIDDMRAGNVFVDEYPLEPYGFHEQLVSEMKQDTSDVIEFKDTLVDELEREINEEAEASLFDATDFLLFAIAANPALSETTVLRKLRQTETNITTQGTDIIDRVDHHSVVRLQELVDGFLAAESEHEEISEKSMIEPRPTSEFHLLVIEDEEDVADFYAEVINTSFDIEISQARGYEDGVAAIDDSVDAILLDRRLGGDRTGADVLGYIDDHDVDPLIAVVSAVSPDDVFLQMRFDYYAEKPITPEELLTLVADLYRDSKYKESARKVGQLTTKWGILNERYDQSELPDIDPYLEQLETEDEDETTAQSGQDVVQSITRDMLANISVEFDENTVATLVNETDSGEADQLVGDVLSDVDVSDADVLKSLIIQAKNSDDDQRLVLLELLRELTGAYPEIIGDNVSLFLEFLLYGSGRAQKITLDIINALLEKDHQYVEDIIDDVFALTQDDKANVAVKSYHVCYDYILENPAAVRRYLTQPQLSNIMVELLANGDDEILTATKPHLLAAATSDPSRTTLADLLFRQYSLDPADLEESMPVLLTYLQQSNYGASLREILDTVYPPVQTAPSRLTPELAKHLDHSDPSVREFFTEMVRRLAAEKPAEIQGLSQLTTAVVDDDEPVCANATEAFYRISQACPERTATYLPDLIDAYTQLAEFQKTCIVRYLGDQIVETDEAFVVDTVVPDLIDICDQSDETPVQRNALIGLAHIHEVNSGPIDDYVSMISDIEIVSSVIDGESLSHAAEHEEIEAELATIVAELNGDVQDSS